MDEPILAFPGTLCDARLFAPLSDRLQRPFVGGDMTGADSASGLAEAALAKAPERFALLGFSLGGFTALDIALRAPRRVTALVLVGSNARADRAENAAVRHAQCRRAAEHGFRALLEDLWPSYVSPDRKADRALLSTLVDMAETTGLAAFERQTRTAIGRRDHRDRLATIDCPTLVMRGDKDILFSAEMQAEMIEGLPLGRAATIPDAGHFALLENPDACARLVLDWIATHPGGRP